MRGPVLPRLWLAPLDVVLPPGAEGWIDADARAALQARRDPIDRRASLIGHCLRRWALTQARPDVGEADWRFVPGPQGKPELAAPFDTLGLHLNVSHAGDRVAVLLDHAPCGVDIEARPAGLEAADLVLTARERRDVAAHPDPTDRFLRYWVVKEAVLKLLGTGLMLPPDWMDVTLDTGSRRAAVRPAFGATLALPPDLIVTLWRLAAGVWLAAAHQTPGIGLQPEPVPWRRATS